MKPLFEDLIWGLEKLLFCLVIEIFKLLDNCLGIFAAIFECDNCKVIFRSRFSVKELINKVIND